MTKTIIKGLPTNEVRILQNGGRDANGDLPEIEISDGGGTQCRHCLTIIEEGEEMYVFSYKPFKSTHAYTERGPICLHKRECAPSSKSEELPESLQKSPEFMMRAYDSSERIIYSTGRIVPFGEIKSYASTLFANDQVDFIHVRSAANNCYQARIEREK